MRRGFIFLILLGLGIVLFIFTLRNVGLAQVIDALFLLSLWKSILVLLLLFLGVVVVGTLKWQMIIKAISSTPPKFSKIFLARWIGYGVSYLTPAALFGGEPVRFYVLKQENKTPPDQIISSIILDKLILVLISSIYFFIGIFFLLVYLVLPPLIETILFILFFLVIVIFCVLLCKAGKASSKKGLFIVLIERFYLNKIKLIKKNQKKLNQIETEVVKFFKAPKKVILGVISLAIIEIAFILLTCWLIVFFISQSLEIPKLFAIKSLADLSYVAPFPAALGSLEVSQAFIFRVLGFSLATGVAFSLILRGLNLIIALSGLLILGWLQAKFITRRIVNFFSNLLPKENKI